MSRDADFEQLTFRSEVNAVPQGKTPVTFPRHWHKDVELMVVPEDVETAAVVRIGMEEYELHAGDIVIVWPGELHEIRSNPAGNLQLLQFPITILNERRSFAVYMNVLKSCRHLVFEQNPEQNQNYLLMIQQLYRISEDHTKPFRDVEMLIVLYELFIALGTSLQGNEPVVEAAQSDKMQEKIIAACEFIRSNCDTNITLESAAEFAGFSPCYFSRYFKKVTSYNFVEFLTIQRVKRLQILLADSSLSITDAAYQAGFRSISTLNRVFRQYSGCSPSEYRKCYKN